MKRRIFSFWIITLLLILLSLFSGCNSKDMTAEKAESLYREFLNADITAVNSIGKTISMYTIYNETTDDMPGQYAMCDMNDDKIPELYIKTTEILRIFQIQKGQVTLLHERTGDCTVLNNGAILYKKVVQLTAETSYEYYILDQQGERQESVNFSFTSASLYSSAIYKINSAKVTKEEYRSYTASIMEIGSDNIQWFDLINHKPVVEDETTEHENMYTISEGENGPDLQVQIVYQDTANTQIEKLFIYDSESGELIQIVSHSGEESGAKSPLYFRDINFDGHMDILIPTKAREDYFTFNAYVWNDSKEIFSECSSFSNIKNPAIDTEQKKILSAYDGNITSSYGIYSYNEGSGKYDQTNSLYIYWLEDGYADLIEMKEGVFEKNIRIPSPYYYVLTQSEGSATQYFAEGSFWDLNSSRWESEFLSEMTQVGSDRWDRVLLSVLYNRNSFQNEKNQATYLKNLKTSKGAAVKADAYALVDQDQDNRNELIIRMTNDARYMLLDYDGTMIRGSFINPEEAMIPETNAIWVTGIFSSEDAEVWSSEKAQNLYEQFLFGEITVLDEQDKEIHIENWLKWNVIQYAYYDMNKDDIPELCIRYGDTLYIFWIRDGKILLWNYSSNSSILSNGAILNKYPDSEVERNRYYFLDYQGNICNQIIFEYFPKRGTYEINSISTTEDIYKSVMSPFAKVRKAELFWKTLGGEEESATDKLLISVLYNQATFINEKGELIYLKDCTISNAKVIPHYYYLVDMDGDGIRELVTYITHGTDMKMIFRYDGKNIYGYEFGTRHITTIKKDGSYSGSGGTSSDSIYRITFNGTNYIETEEAYYTHWNKEYRIEGKSVSREEIESYFAEWDARENVKSIDIWDYE